MTRGFLCSGRRLLALAYISEDNLLLNAENVVKAMCAGPSLHQRGQSITKC